MDCRENVLYKFKYYGTVSVLSGDGIFSFSNIDKPEEPPILLMVDGVLADYLWKVSNTDFEEKYLKSDFCYGSILHLNCVIIPGDKEDIPAKVITSKYPLKDELVIFGPKEIIDDPHPKSMSRNEYSKWLDWLISDTYKDFDDILKKKNDVNYSNVR